MKSLNFRILMGTLSVLAWMTYAFSAPMAINSDEYKSRMQNLRQSTQEQVTALSQQIEGMTEQSKIADLEHQIETIKHDAETHRLEILLEWAQAAGDEARVTEVQTALESWINPPQPEAVPNLERTVAPEKKIETSDESSR